MISSLSKACRSNGRHLVECALLIGIFSALPGFGAVTPAGIFADSMVVQRGIRVPIWGWATVGEQITVVFNGQTVTATARDSTLAPFKGYWKVFLASMSAGGPYDMTISGSASPTVTLHGLLVGDVWVCSGQSNMRYTIAGLYLGDNTPEVQTLPPDSQPLTQVRMCKMGASWSSNLALDIQVTNVWDDVDQHITAPWRSCSKTTGMQLSATAAVFGINLYRKINVPIGLITAAVGQTSLKDWVSPELSDTIVWRQCGGKPDTVIQQRTQIRYTNGGNAAGALFSGMISPILGLGIKGVIWWQGENESEGFDPICDYSSGGFKQLIREWRRRWGQGDFPFLYVQVHQQLGTYLTGINDIRDAQMQALGEPNTGMAVSFDSCYMIHPPDHYVPARRLAIVARAVAYGENVEYMGPIYNGMTIEGSTIRVKLAHVGGGLSKRDLIFFEGDNSLAVGANTLSSSADAAAPYEIAGADNVYHRADAVISTNNTVVVSAPGVSAPKNVRYAMESSSGAKTPLYNTNDLPASMFQSATWSGLGSATALDNGPDNHVAGAVSGSRVLKFVGGRLVVAQHAPSTGALVRSVNIYNVKGCLVGTAPVSNHGSVVIDRRTSGDQLLLVNVR